MYEAIIPYSAEPHVRPTDHLRWWCVFLLAGGFGNRPCFLLFCRHS